MNTCDLEDGRRPPEATLRWVRGAVGPGSTIASVRLMKVSSTTVHAVDVLGRTGLRHELVLRRFHDGERLRTDPWYAPANEARVLELLGDSEVPAPRLIAADTDPRVCDFPALLTTRIPGQPIDSPHDMESFLTQLARTLTVIHAVDAAREPALGLYGAYYDPAVDGERRPPSWSRHPGMWDRVFEVLAAPGPASDAGFIHRDYHPGQTLWVDGMLTGVVDWTTGCYGPRGVDLGWMGMNLSDHGLDVAESFLAIHRKVAGRDLHHPYWDLVNAADLILDLPEPQSLEGRLSHARFEDWVARALAEL